MKCPNKSGNRFQEVSEISRSLKDISMEFDTRMIVAAQVSRVAENRPGGDNRPQMSDLRESGDIEADADLIIFPHRPSLYWKKAGQPPPPDELIIVKNRQGRTGIIQVEYKGAHYKFVERI
jgi:replicative DNA helicase